MGVLTLWPQWFKTLNRFHWIQPPRHLVCRTLSRQRMHNWLPQPVQGKRNSNVTFVSIALILNRKDRAYPITAKYICHPPLNVNLVPRCWLQDGYVHINTHSGARHYYESYHRDQLFKSSSPLSHQCHHRKLHPAPKYECPFCHNKMLNQRSNCKAHWSDSEDEDIACPGRRQQRADKSIRFFHFWHSLTT